MQHLFCLFMVSCSVLYLITVHNPPVRVDAPNAFEFHSCEPTLQVRGFRYFTPLLFTAWTTRVPNPLCSPRFRASLPSQPDSSLQLRSSSQYLSILSVLWLFPHHNCDSHVLATLYTLLSRTSLLAHALPIILARSYSPAL